jgi:hypothetical protein
VRFTDFLKTTVLLTAGEATALGAVTVVAAGSKDDTVANLLAEARTSRALPELRPAAVLLNRLWPLGISALIAAGISWLYPQVASVATGYAILVALAWRRQEAAVSAIEGRDGARFYVLPTSPFGGISLMRTPGYRHILENGAGP